MVKPKTLVMLLVPTGASLTGPTGASLTGPTGASLTGPTGASLEIPIDVGTEWVLKLNPCHYQLKCDVETMSSTDAPKYMGFIAEQVQTIQPSLTLSDAAGIDYSRINVPLILAIKTLDARVRDITTQLHELDLLQKRVETLKASRSTQ